MCQERLLELKEDWEKCITLTEVVRVQRDRAHSLADGSRTHRSTEAGYMWLRANVCYAYGNLLFCSSMVREVLGVSRDRICCSRTRSISRRVLNDGHVFFSIINAIPLDTSMEEWRPGERRWLQVRASIPLAHVPSPRKMCSTVAVEEDAPHVERTETIIHGQEDPEHFSADFDGAFTRLLRLERSQALCAAFREDEEENLKLARSHVLLTRRPSAADADVALAMDDAYMAYAPHPTALPKGGHEHVDFQAAMARDIVWWSDGPKDTKTNDPVR